MVDVSVRLAEVVTALERVGLTGLVMGGHAVRFYGLRRDTVDFDIHLAPERWDELPELLARTGLFEGPAIEGSTWRPGAFRRFQIGRLPDGLEEWLEFWRTNHLLPPFAEVFARREIGEYGGRPLAFLSLPDLIRSKETVRARDWQDVETLEGILDARLIASNSVAARAAVRSARGFEDLLQRGHLADAEAVATSLASTRHPVTQAFLLPSAPAAALPDAIVPIEPVVVQRLRRETPGSGVHLALVEAVRRRYRQALQDADHADKEAIRRAQADQ